MSTKIVSVIIGALGTIKKGLDQKLQLLSGHKLAIELQQIALMSTAQIVCTVLDFLFGIKEILASNLIPFTISNKHQLHSTVHATL